MTNEEILKMIKEKIKTYKLIRENELFYTLRFNEFLRLYHLFAPNLAILPSHLVVIVLMNFYSSILSEHPYTREINHLEWIKKELENGNYNYYIDTTKEEYETEERKRLEENYKEYNKYIEKSKALKIIKKM